MEVNTSAFFKMVGDIARSTGQDDFYEKLVSLPATVMGSYRYLVIRYSRYSIPDIIVNNALTNDATESYRQGLYRLDPILRLTQSGFMSGVVTLANLRLADDSNKYFDEIFRSATIFDELTILIRAPGKICLALCIDRSSHTFTDEEVQQIELLLPMLEGLNHAHLDQCFEKVLSHNAGQAMDAATKMNNHPVMVLDRDSAEIWENSAWSKFAEQHPTQLSKIIHKNRDNGVVSLGQGNVLHWEKTSNNFALAPGGKICMIERRSAGYLGKSLEILLSSFSTKFKLTTREQEIIKLAVRGYPNQLISKKLGISAGTVRNHKYRLYYKLNITSERELFLLFLKEVTRPTVATCHS